MEQRRYTLHKLRNLGFGKNTMEDIIAEEASDLCKYLEGTNGEAIDVRNEFNVSVLSVLWRLISNERLPRDDKKLKKLLWLLDKALQESQSFLARLTFVIRPLFYPNKYLKIYANFEAFSGMRQYAVETFEKHVETYQDDNMRDFIDHYIKEIKEKSSKQEHSTFKGNDGKLNIEGIIVDLFIAGSETTSTTLNWAMLFMILNPEIQEKVHEELDKVVGRSRAPTYADKAETPFTEAVLHEVQRMGNILSQAVSHFTRQGGTLGNGKYVIPPKSIIFCNLGAVLYDPRHFPEPKKFDPARYLSPEGKFTPNPKVIPFGLGRRRCLGESLAKMELYVFFTTIMGHFKVTKLSPYDSPSIDPIMGATTSPKPYQLRFESRE